MTVRLPLIPLFLPLLALTAVPALAQGARTPPPAEAVAPNSQAAPAPRFGLNNEPDSERPVQSAALPPDTGTAALLGAIHDNAGTSRALASLSPVPPGRIEIRDAAALERQAQDPTAVRTALNDNGQGVDDLRRSLIRNRQIDRDLARQQVPINHVVAADVANNGKVVIYAYPQGVVPPR